MFEEFCWEICETSWDKLWLRKDKVLNLHACLFFFSVFNFKNIKKISKICVFVFFSKIVQVDLYFIKLKKINFDIWPD